MVKIAQDLQELIFTLAKYDLPTNEAVDLNNFKIELVGFIKGSAVPKFAYTPRVENKTGLFWQEQRNTVNEKFEKLVAISNSGDYGKIIELYPEPIKRNPVVENLYAFANDFGDAPVSFVEYDEINEKITPIFKINPFKSAIKKTLTSELIEIVKTATESGEAVGKIKITKRDGKTHRKILATYSGNKFSLEYAPSVIMAGTVTYVLKYPLRCLFA